MKLPSVLSGLIFVLVVFGWEVAGQTGVVAEYILPAPSTIAREIYTSRELLLSHTYVTTLEIILGFILALVFGVLVAGLLVYFPVLEPIAYPWLVITQVIPKVAIAPLLLMWLGFGLLPKVLIAFSVAFFPILIDTMIGLRSVEREPIFLLQSMGAGKLRAFWYVRLPTALPYILGSTKVAITLATVGAIVGEFVGSNTGLGYLLLYANGNVNSPLLFAALTIISFLALLLFCAVSVAETLILHWHVSQRTLLRAV